MKTEALISKERPQAQQYLDVAGVMLAVLDKNWKINLINKKGCQILGYDENEILHQNWFDLCIHDDVREDIVGVFNKLMTGNIESVEYFENPIISKSGEKKIIAFHNTLIMDDDSNITGILFSGENITERKQDEKKLKASEDKYSTLVEKGNDGIIIIQDFVLKFVNSRMIELTGFTKEEVIGKPFYDYVSSEYKEMLMERVKKRLKGEAVPIKYEISILSKDGSIIPVEISASLIEYEGRPADMAIIRDITERLQTEKELQERMNELETFYRTTLGREERVIELKQEVNELLEQLGKNNKYRDYS